MKLSNYKEAYEDFSGLASSASRSVHSSAARPSLTSETRRFPFPSHVEFGFVG